MKKVYLAYGSNTNLTQMGHRCPDAAVIGSTVLKGHRLTFKGKHGNGVATIENPARTSRSSCGRFPLGVRGRSTAMRGFPTSTARKP